MVRLMRGALGAVAMAGLAACAGMETPATAGSAEDEAAIRAISTQYAQANTARDAAALAQLMTEDYETVFPDGTRQSGRAAMQATMEQEFAGMPAEMTMTVSATTDYFRWLGADAAVAGGTWSIAGMPAGTGPDRGSWMAVFRRDADGQWRMSHSLGAAYMAPPPATTP